MTLNIPTSNPVERIANRVRGKSFACLKRLRHTLSPARSPQVVFLLGSGRSGTDIAASCLAGSLDLALINEDNPLAFDNWRLKNLDVVQAAVNRSGARRVLLKPIVETLKARELLGHFTGSKVLFVFREYNDAINSMVRFFGQNHVKAVNGWIEQDFAQFPQLPEEERDFIRSCWSPDLSMANASGIYWLVYNKAFFYLGLDQNPRVHLSNYEELVTAPAETLEDMCQFIGLKYQPRMARFVYSSSVKRGPPPSLEARLEQSCAQVWQRLCAQRKSQASAAAGPLGDLAST